MKPAALSFLHQFIRRPQETGAIAASGPALARLIVEAADLPQAQTVVELGPGTGVFTRRIAAQLPKDAVFFALEKNPAFAKLTTTNCPGALVYTDSADRLNHYLAQNNRPNCDVVISGLPWSVFDDQTQASIIENIALALSPKGKFLTFAYIHDTHLPAGQRFYARLKNTFAEVAKTRIVWNNLPPAFVYVCRGRKNSETVVA